MRAPRLSPRAKDAMLFIQRYIARSGEPPTYVEIKDGIGVSSKSSAHRVVAELHDAGYLARRRNVNRGIELLRLLPDDRMEAAAKAVCAALGHSEPSDVKKAREALVSTLIERSAA